jgi:hypothetical protein
MVRWEFYPERVITATEASSTEFQWRMFPQVVQTSTGFLLYLNDRAFHWIPIHAFADPEDVNRLSRLIQCQSLISTKKVPGNDSR